MFVVKIVEIANGQISCLVLHFFILGAVTVASVFAYKEPALIEEHYRAEKRIKKGKWKTEVHGLFHCKYQETCNETE